MQKGLKNQINRYQGEKGISYSIIKFLAKKGSKKILDVGCGYGWLVKDLREKGFEAFGCDLSEDALVLARKFNKVGHYVKKASAISLPYHDASFDVVLAISMIEHLTPKEVKIFLKEARRVLKPKGWFFIVTPNKITPLRLIYQILGQKWPASGDPTHRHFYTPSSLKKLLRQYSFCHFQLTFNSSPSNSLDWRSAPLFFKTPKFIKKFLNHLLVSVSPFYYLRNSFWLATQKDKENL